MGGGEIYGKPGVWIKVAAPGRSDGADAALRVVLGYVGARALGQIVAELDEAPREQG